MFTGHSQHIGKSKKYRMDGLHLLRLPEYRRSNGLVVTFRDVVYGECTGEGSQAVNGTLHVRRGEATYSTPCDGSDTEFPSRECQEVGNDGY